MFSPPCTKHNIKNTGFQRKSKKQKCDNASAASDIKKVGGYFKIALRHSPGRRRHFVNPKTVACKTIAAFSVSVGANMGIWTSALYAANSLKASFMAVKGSALQCRPKKNNRAAGILCFVWNNSIACLQALSEAP